MGSTGPPARAGDARAEPEREQAQHLRGLFENTADGVWISGPTGRTLFWNRGAEAILGYCAREVVGRPCGTVFAGRDRHGNRICGWPCPIKQMFRDGGLAHHFDMETRTKAGTPLWLDVSCIAVPPRGREPPTTVHLFRDVTAARLIEQLVRQQLLRQREAAAGEPRPAAGNLSLRERQVLALLRKAETTAGIAARLSISRVTVRNHVQSIFRKLGVHSRLEAVAATSRP